MLPDNFQVELPIGNGNVSGDADHGTVAIGTNGDIVAVWHVKDDQGDSQEIHAAYFKLYHQPSPHWIAGPPQVLACQDKQLRGCMKPDIIATHDENDPTSVAFVATWGRRNKQEKLGKLETCLILPPPGKGASPVIVHSDGVSGYVLDSAVDSTVARIAPDLVWHRELGLGRVGVVYSDLVSDNGTEASVALHWRETILPSDGSLPISVGESELVASVAVFGEIYALAGGKVTPDAQLVPSGNGSLRLAVAYEECVQGQTLDGSQIGLAAFDYVPGQAPVPVLAVTLLPDSSQSQRYLRRPNVAWNEVRNNTTDLEVACYSVEDPAIRLKDGVSFTVNLSNGAVSHHDWDCSAASQNTPIPIALDGSRAVFYHDDGVLGYVQQGAQHLVDGAHILGTGRVPHVAWRENVANSGDELVVICSFGDSAIVPGNPRRIQLQVLADSL